MPYRPTMDEQAGDRDQSDLEDYLGFLRLDELARTEGIG